MASMFYTNGSEFDLQFASSTESHPSFDSNFTSERMSPYRICDPVMVMLCSYPRPSTSRLFSALVSFDLIVACSFGCEFVAPEVLSNIFVGLSRRVQRTCMQSICDWFGPCLWFDNPQALSIVSANMQGANWLAKAFSRQNSNYW